MGFSNPDNFLNLPSLSIVANTGLVLLALAVAVGIWVWTRDALRQDLEKLAREAEDDSTPPIREDEVSYVKTLILMVSVAVGVLLWALLWFASTVFVAFGVPEQPAVIVTIGIVSALCAWGVRAERAQKRAEAAYLAQYKDD